MRWIALLLLAACGGKSDTSTPNTGADGTPTGTDATTSAVPCEGVTPEVHEITPAELDAMLGAKDFELINVHVPNEGEIPGTDAHIAYTDLAGIEAHLGALDAKVVVYCKTGPMSAIASADLVDAGYCNVYDMPAGMIGWEGAGFPLAR